MFAHYRLLLLGFLNGLLVLIYTPEIGSCSNYTYYYNFKMETGLQIILFSFWSDKSLHSRQSFIYLQHTGCQYLNHCLKSMSDQSWDSIAQGLMLVGHCLKSDFYLQFCGKNENWQKTGNQQNNWPFEHIRATKGTKKQIFY